LRCSLYTDNVSSVAISSRAKVVPAVSDSQDAAVDSRAGELAEQIVQRLRSMGPTGWERMAVTFALTADQSMARVVFTIGDRSAQFAADSVTVHLARQQRELTAKWDSGPWWRMILRARPGGEVGIEYDDGRYPFPEGWLFTPQAYEADLAAYPRERLPVWLGAYLRHGGRQQRIPQRAAADGRSDAEHGVRPTDSTGLLPEPTVLWERWALLAAVFVAEGSPLGPRILPSLGVFEGATSRSGSTLYILPGGRAVLSGGVWDAPELAAAYNGGGKLPNLYAGAPNWVANSVLNPRAGTGLLSFCYWHDGRCWYRGESPVPDEFAQAVPGVGDTDILNTLILQRVAAEPTATHRDSVAALVAVAESRKVTRDHLEVLFGGEFADIDGALYQLEIAGLTPASAKPRRRRK